MAANISGCDQGSSPLAVWWSPGPRPWSCGAVSCGSRGEGGVRSGLKKAGARMCLPCLAAASRGRGHIAAAASIPDICSRDPAAAHGCAPASSISWLCSCVLKKLGGTAALPSTCPRPLTFLIPIPSFCCFAVVLIFLMCELSIYFF